MVRIGPLSLEHHRRLREMRRRALGRVAMRARLVLLSTRGYTVPQIADIFELGEDVVPRPTASTAAWTPWSPRPSGSWPRGAFRLRIRSPPGSRHSPRLFESVPLLHLAA
jgi:hypothetical protein